MPTLNALEFVPIACGTVTKPGSAQSKPSDDSDDSLDDDCDEDDLLDDDEFTDDRLDNEDKLDEVCDEAELALDVDGLDGDDDDRDDPELALEVEGLDGDELESDDVDDALDVELDDRELDDELFDDEDDSSQHVVQSAARSSLQSRFPVSRLYLMPIGIYEQGSASTMTVPSSSSLTDSTPPDIVSVFLYSTSCGLSHATRVTNETSKSEPPAEPGMSSLSPPSLNSPVPPW